MPAPAMMLSVRHAPKERRTRSQAEMLKASPALFVAGLSPLSKAARCYLLAAQGRIELSLAPRVSKAVVVRPHQTIEEAASEALRECLDQIATNMVVVEKLDDTEGPHQLRNGLRRFRCVCSIYAPALAGPERVRLAAEARWLGQQVGRLRDLDVMANELWAISRAEPAKPFLQAMAAAFSRKAEMRRKRLRALLVQPRARFFLADLARFVGTWAWTVSQQSDRTRIPMTSIELACLALSKRWSAVRAQSHQLGEMKASQLHDLRKEVRKLRHTVEFMQSVFPGSHVDKLLNLLKMLQTHLGSLNDASTMQTMLRQEALVQQSPEAQSAFDWFIRASNNRSTSDWRALRTAWLDFEATRAFWV